MYMRKSDLTDKMKRSFFLAAVTSILLYGCTTWTLTKRLEKKLDGNYTRMLRAILSKSWRQHPKRHQLYGHLPPITKTIQVRRTRHAGHCWRSRDELISDVLLWTPTHGRAKAGRPARTYIQQLCEDTGCCPEDLPRAMNDREKWRERVRDIRATSTTWWWWWWWQICARICICIWYKLTIRRILEGVRAKNLQATLLFIDFSKAFDSIHRGKMEQILLAYGLPKETVAAYNVYLYRNTKVKVRSPDGDTEYFDIVAGVLQGWHTSPVSSLSSV